EGMGGSAVAVPLIAFVPEPRPGTSTKPGVARTLCATRSVAASVIYPADPSGSWLRLLFKTLGPADRAAAPRRPARMPVMVPGWRAAFVRRSRRRRSLHDALRTGSHDLI